MFKRVLMAVVVAVTCAVSARSDSGIFDIMNDSFTINDVAVSSYVAAGTHQIFTAALSGATTSFPTLMENRKVLEIQNTDSTASVWCRIALSSTSANGDLSLSAPGDLSVTAGRKIAAGGTWVLGLPARNNEGRVFIPHCVNSGGTGTAALTISQGRNK